MKKLVLVVITFLGCTSVFAATNYFTGAVNNQTQNGGNWSLGSWTDWDDAVVSDWTAVRNSGTALAQMYYNSITFNNEINAVGVSPFIYNTAVTTSNTVRDSITINSDVTKNIRLGGAYASDDGDLTINHNGSANLEAYQAFKQSTLDVSYVGNNLNTVVFGGGAINSKYNGTTLLDNVTANAAGAGATGVRGLFGVGGDVVLANGTVLNLANYTIENDITAAVGSSTKITKSSGNLHNNLTADGSLLYQGTGVSWMNGKLSGAGDFDLRAGTLVFNNTAGSSDASGTVTIRGIAQSRSSDPFGTATVILKDAANFRGFNDQAGETISILNDIEIDADTASSIVRIASTGGANSSPHTVVENIAFTSDGNLSLQATANNASVLDTSIVDVTGVISDGVNTGNIIIDNEWGGTSYANGVVKLHEANTYSGKTTVEDGRVQLVSGGSIDGSSLLLIKENGIFDVSTRTGGAYTFGNTVQGTGLIEGDITLTGLVQPGPGTGTLNFGDALTLGGSGILAIELYGYGNNDKLANDGGDLLTLGSSRTAQFNFNSWAEAGSVTNGTIFTIFEDWGSFGGSADHIIALGLDAGQSVDASNLLVDGTVTVIPEPGVLGMMALVGTSFVFLRRLMI
ncbi:MAG: hypothetical protein DRP64_01930 [Verrucomicrobia bacterium]|nr:MAG: hypothetical protein DRP64_01930 [Verrucomicrobiota bacterium]